MMKRLSSLCSGIALLTVLSACTIQSQRSADVPVTKASSSNTSASNTSIRRPQQLNLSGTQWQLVNIQSMDDSRYVPDQSTRYQLSFMPQRRLVIVADCNRGGGIWTQTSISEVSFSKLLSTQAECGAQSLYSRYMNNLENVRSFVYQNGHLFLATKADGAILEFAPIE